MFSECAREGTGDAEVVTCLIANIVPDGGCLQAKMKNTSHNEPLGNLQPTFGPICFSIRGRLV